MIVRNRELEELLKLVDIEKEEEINGFKFYIGKINEYPIIISQTQVGVINASMATLIAIQKYNPIAIINQGIAGAHVDYIHRNLANKFENWYDNIFLLASSQNLPESSFYPPVFPRQTAEGLPISNRQSPSDYFM